MVTNELPPVHAVDGFSRSSEYWGIGYYPRPLLIVTQRVRQLMLKHKIKGLVFEPVIIVE